MRREQSGSVVVQRSQTADARLSLAPSHLPCRTSVRIPSVLRRLHVDRQCTVDDDSCECDLS